MTDYGENARAIAQDRFGLGAHPDQRVEGDPRDWLMAQMLRYDPAPAVIAAEPSSEEMLARIADYRRERGQMREDAKQRQAEAQPAESMSSENMSSEGEPMVEEAPQAASRRQLRVAYATGATARVSSALSTDAPFVERMVHFWANHFAISADKGSVTPLAASYEFEAIRPYVLGSFKDLLTAAVLHPAMLNYLDQSQSVGPGSEMAARSANRRRANGNMREVGLNENLAREILELHTLGVRSGYSQDDVTEFARALTGWTISGSGGGRNARNSARKPGEVMFVDRLHEPGARTILGKRYSENGPAQSLAVIDDLARSPATARFVATKLARHFVADTPPASIIARLEQAYLKSDGDLPTVYQALITAAEPWAEPNAKFRNPWDWTIASLRALGVDEMPGRRGALNTFQQLGMPVWQPGSPAGYADLASEWAGPGALIARVEFAQQIAQRSGNRIDARKVAEELLADKLNAETLQAISRSESPSTGLALMIASPEFMRR